MASNDTNDTSATTDAGTMIGAAVLHPDPKGADDSPKPLWDSRDMYDVYTCTLRFRDRVCGGTPKNPNLLKGWIAATTEHDDETTTAQEKEAREALLEPTEEKSWNGFPGDKTGGLFLWSRQIKALFKECASMLRVTVTRLGSKQIFQHGFEIKGTAASDRVYLGVHKPTDYWENPIHVMTAQGPRTALKRVDYVEGATITFEIWVLTTAAAEKRHIGADELTAMLRFGQENGLGADRSQGYGKFDVLAFEKVSAGKNATSTDPIDGPPAKGKKGKAGAKETVAEA